MGLNALRPRNAVSEARLAAELHPRGGAQGRDPGQAESTTGSAVDVVTEPRRGQELRGHVHPDDSYEGRQITILVCVFYLSTLVVTFPTESRRSMASQAVSTPVSTRTRSHGAGAVDTDAIPRLSDGARRPADVVTLGGEAAGHPQPLEPARVVRLIVAVWDHQHRSPCAHGLARGSNSALMHDDPCPREHGRMGRVGNGQYGWRQFPARAIGGIAADQ
jgi:hypothetical protein